MKTLPAMNRLLSTATPPHAAPQARQGIIIFPASKAQAVEQALQHTQHQLQQAIEQANTRPSSMDYALSEALPSPEIERKQDVRHMLNAWRDRLQALLERGQDTARVQAYMKDLFNLKDDAYSVNWNAEYTRRLMQQEGVNARHTFMLDALKHAPEHVRLLLKNVAASQYPIMDRHALIVQGTLKLKLPVRVQGEVPVTLRHSLAPWQSQAWIEPHIRRILEETPSSAPTEQVETRLIKPQTGAVEHPRFLQS
jgi:hypothetical protein